MLQRDRRYDFVLLRFGTAVSFNHSLPCHTHQSVDSLFKPAVSRRFSRASPGAFPERKRWKGSLSTGVSLESGTPKALYGRQPTAALHHAACMNQDVISDDLCR